MRALKQGCRCQTARKPAARRDAIAAAGTVRYPRQVRAVEKSRKVEQKKERT